MYNLEQQEPLCDCCNDVTSFDAGTYYTTSEFVEMLRKGLEPGQAMLYLAEVSGIERDTLLTALPNEIRTAFSSSWLLCPSCAVRAGKFLTRVPGRVAQHRRELPVREKTAMEELSPPGAGKLAVIVGALGVRVMTGGSLSISTEGKCDFCSAVMARDEMQFIPAGEMQRAVRDGFHPFGKTRILKQSAVSDVMVQKWQEGALRDNTNWGLCQDCSGAFRQYAAPSPDDDAPSADAQTVKKWWRFWE